MQDVRRDIPFPSADTAVLLAKVQPYITFLQSYFGAFALGDLADDFRGVDDIARNILERRNRWRHIERAAILSHAQRLIMLDPFPPPEPRQYFALFVEPVRRNEACDRLTDHLLGAISENACCSGVPTGERPVKCFAEDRVRG